MKRTFCAASMLILCVTGSAVGPGTNDPPIWGPEVISVTPSTLQARREALLTYCFGTPSWPATGSWSRSQSNINPAAVSWLRVYTNSTNCAKIDWYMLATSAAPATGSVTSTLIRMTPITPRSTPNQVVILHTGHSSGVWSEDYYYHLLGWVAPGIDLIDAGYDVVGINDVLYDGNGAQTVMQTNGASVTFYNHDQMFANLELPWRFFLGPIHRTINLLYPSATNIYMVGLSGGGLMATLYPALDPRITMSFPVAGSHPHWMNKGWLQDSEQVDPGFFEIANLCELYVMAASNGYHLQMTSLRDDCCFWGTGYQAWYGMVKSAMHSYPVGQYGYYLDVDNPTHRYSRGQMDTILAQLAAGVPARPVLPRGVRFVVPE